jgi:hypothetical protein
VLFTSGMAPPTRASVNTRASELAFVLELQPENARGGARDVDCRPSLRTLAPLMIFDELKGTCEGLRALMRETSGRDLINAVSVGEPVEPQDELHFFKLVSWC